MTQYPRPVQFSDRFVFLNSCRGNHTDEHGDDHHTADHTRNAKKTSYRKGGTAPAKVSDLQRAKNMIQS